MIKKPALINLLFRGDTKPTLEEDEYVKEFRVKGLQALTVPPLSFEFSNLLHLLNLLQKPVASSKGLIITSPRVVEAIQKSLMLIDGTTRKRILDSLCPNLVFVVGEKTAIKCVQIGISCNQESAKSGNSFNLASFIKNHVTQPVSLIYPKGSLTDNFFEQVLTTKKSLATSNSNSLIHIDSVVVYETKKADNLHKLILTELQEVQTSLLTETAAITGPIILNSIFFSPSGVEAFLSLNREELQRELEHLFSCKVESVMSSIGKTTEAALKGYNLTCFCVSLKPNASSLVDCVLQQLNKLDRV